MQQDILALQTKAQRLRQFAQADRQDAQALSSASVRSRQESAEKAAWARSAQARRDFATAQRFNQVSRYLERRSEVERDKARTKMDQAQQRLSEAKQFDNQAANLQRTLADLSRQVDQLGRVNGTSGSDSRTVVDAPRGNNTRRCWKCN